MSTEKTTIPTDTTQQESDRPALVKKIGNTIYEVSFYFSTTSKETMSDKIMRLIKHDTDTK